MTTVYTTQAQPQMQAHTPIIATNNQPQFYTTQEPSPASSASPTSSRMSDALPHYAPNPAKQLRPLKSPLYVPAVLRPNEHFSQSPMTPPKSLYGSLDSLNETDGEESAATIQGDLDLALQISFEDGRELEEVTGPPTREHWKPDEASPNCDSPQCRSSFNIFTRKHHCRHCGHIFCASHASYTIPLDQSAKFHPEGVPSRACETCHRQYQRWDNARSIRRKNSDNSDESTLDSGVTTPIDARLGGQRIPGSRGGSQEQPAANSVPRDWAWSTF